MSKEIPNDKVQPAHYAGMSIPTWEMMLRVYGPEHFISHCEMTAIKYRMRMGSKEGEEWQTDLLKAQWYEAKAKEIKESMAPRMPY